MTARISNNEEKNTDTLHRNQIIVTKYIEPVEAFIYARYPNTSGSMCGCLDICGHDVVINHYLKNYR